MHLFLLILTVLFSIFSALKLPDNRLACRDRELIYIPNENDYFEEAVELSFNSAHSYNNIAISRIVAEECDLRDSDFLFGSHRRLKRSAFARGVHHLSKLLKTLFQKGQKFLSPRLLKDLSNVLKKVAISKATSKSFDFWYTLWKNPDQIRQELKDEHLDEMLENALRGSIQMLRQEGQLSEFMLHHPNIIEKLKRRLPVGNSHLLSQITAVNVECHQSYRDSQVTIFLKVRIPKIEKVNAKQCDDIGIIDGRSYLYYNLPSMTFPKEDGQVLQVQVDHCRMEKFLYCPPSSIKKTECTENTLEMCELKKEVRPQNFSRELARGFAVYGNFTLIILEENGVFSKASVKPRRLYHLVPRKGQVLIVGGQEFSQDNGNEPTVVREV